jgi:hypothetical protein
MGSPSDPVFKYKEKYCLLCLFPLILSNEAAYKASFWNVVYRDPDN